MRRSLEDIKHMVDWSKNYPGLTSDLKPYYAYITDCGHSIMAVPKTLLAQHEGTSEELWQFEVPIPVKYLLTHTFYIYEGYIIIDVPYNSVFGVEVEEGYEEY